MKTGLNDGSSTVESYDDSGDQTSLDVAPEKSAWISPELKEFGNLSFVVKGISYNPLDGVNSLTP